LFFFVFKLDIDQSSTIIPLVSEETFDKESIPLTASSSFTLRTTSDDDMTNFEQPPSVIETQQKVFFRFRSIIYLVNQFHLAFSSTRGFSSTHNAHSISTTTYPNDSTNTSSCSITTNKIYNNN
jgi:hypothetical protein